MVILRARVTPRAWRVVIRAGLITIDIRNRLRSLARIGEHGAFKESRFDGAFIIYYRIRARGLVTLTREDRRGRFVDRWQV